jgi:hypothetical protein
MKNQPKNLRASDQESFFSENRSDFIIRRHQFSRQQAITIILTLAAIVTGVAFLVINDMMIGSIICAIAGLPLFVIGKQTERLKRALATTEFLNALFSSAIGKDHKFSIIVKQDNGQIVYLNRDFQKMFPSLLELPKRSLEELLSLYNVAESDKKSILKASKKGSAEEFAIKIDTDKDKKKIPITFSIEPIQRPNGFCLIRGA